MVEATACVAMRCGEATGCGTVLGKKQGRKSEAVKLLNFARGLVRQSPEQGPGLALVRYFSLARYFSERLPERHTRGAETGPEEGYPAPFFGLEGDRWYILRSFLS